MVSLSRWSSSWPQGLWISTILGSGSILVAIEVAASGTLSRLCFPRDVTDCGACLRARPHDMARLLAVGGLCISASGSRVPMLGRQTTYVVDICDWKDRPVVEGRVVAKVTKAGVSCIRFASSDWWLGWPLSGMRCDGGSVPKGTYILREGGGTVALMKILRFLEPETGGDGLPSQPLWSANHSLSLRWA